MFRITEDPSSGSLIQCLAKITRIVLSCPLTWTWSVLWQQILTRWACVQFRELHTRTDHVHVNGHDSVILVILAKYCKSLTDDGSSVIRNMLEHFLNIL